MLDREYYSDQDNWGSYQYVTIEEIVNDIMANRNPDDYISTTERYRIVNYVKRGIKELVFDVVQDIKAIELELSPSLNVIVPPDYVNYVRISWIDDKGKLRPMIENRNVPMFTSYLQDHDYQILFDNEGNVLTDSSMGNMLKNEDISKETSCFQFEPNKDNAKVFPNGTFSINRASGVIQFGSDIQGKNLVLEYLSDGVSMDESEIRIHKFAEAAVINFVYYELIKNRRNVPANEKMRARKEYYNSHRIAKRRMSKFTKVELLQVMSGSTKWIK